MDSGTLAILVAFARNVFYYKQKIKKQNGRKVSRRVYKESKDFLKDMKKKFVCIIPEQYWDFYYLYQFYEYMYYGKANSVEEAIKLYEQKEIDFIESLN